MSLTIQLTSGPPRSANAVRKPNRNELLARIIDPARLPTPPAVALQVVNLASQPDCDPKDIVSVLNLDPALCGKLLSAVNSCLYGLQHPVASLVRAVYVLGLNTVRSLALGLSLPAVRTQYLPDQTVQDYWLSSVGGAIIARELAILTRRPNPEEDLASGLLRNLGQPLLREAFADTWADHLSRNADRLLDDPCGAEVASFGIDHADVSAELLRGWKLPDEIVEPVRHHHQPSFLATGPQHQLERAELLHFASQLVHLDAIAQRPDHLDRLLATAQTRFHLSQPALIEFLQRVAPKVGAFAALLDQDIGRCPDFAAILAAGAAELVNLTVQTNRERLSDAVPVSETNRIQPRTKAETLPGDSPVANAGVRSELPEFRPEFADDWPKGGCQLGEYELREILGRGAMGIVFKAFEPSLNRFVAIKMLAPNLATMSTTRQRFIREGKLAAAIQHENVVAVYAVRVISRVTCLVMEFVDGCSLESHIQRQGPLPLHEFTTIASQLTAGLAAAHKRQIIHRDIKPANVLIENGTGRVKLTDFGLARACGDAKLTADGVQIGTPYYMAPEIVQGHPATVASDLFGLGGVLYLMATGKLPFPGTTLPGVFRSVCSTEPIHPRQRRPDLPEYFEELILHLLEKNPLKRPPCAADIASFLEGLEVPTRET